MTLDDRYQITNVKQPCIHCVIVLLIIDIHHTYSHAAYVCIQLFFQLAARALYVLDGQTADCITASHRVNVVYAQAASLPDKLSRSICILVAERLLGYAYAHHKLTAVAVEVDV